jgi:HlyD family secretion protein
VNRTNTSMRHLKPAVWVSLLLLGGSAYVFRAELAPVGEWALRVTENSRLVPRVSASAAPDHYRTAPVKRGDLRQVVTATGTLNAVVTVEVSTQSSGQLAKLFVDFNDSVRKGQPLAELDQRTPEARLAEAQAATTMALTLVEVEKAKIERVRVNLAEAQAQTTVLQARLENARARRQSAESVLQRLQTLQGRGVTPVSQVEQAQAERDAAAANVREAEALLGAHVHAIARANADLKTAEAELANAVAAVPHKRAARRLAEVELERTIIRSPVDGVVVGRGFNEGQTVAASLEAPTLFTIAGDLEQMDLHARVDESDIGKIKVGQKASFTVDAHPDRRFEAEVIAVRMAPETPQQSVLATRKGSQAPSNVVSYTVILRTHNPGGLLLPGMTAVVRITVEETRDALTVPVAALRFTPRSSQLKPKASQESAAPHEVVWRPMEKGGLRPVTVRVGVADGVNAAIANTKALEALQEGDQVVVAEVIDTAPSRFSGLRLGF